MKAVVGVLGHFRLGRSESHRYKCVPSCHQLKWRQLRSRQDFRRNGLAFLADVQLTAASHTAGSHSRATTAAWEVIPPWLVTMAWLTTMPSMSSGEVSWRTKMTFLPKEWWSLARSAVKTISPVAAPGLAGSPEPRKEHLAELFLQIQDGWAG